MRVSRHNGRAGAHGTYNPKHNDREFNLENSEDIKKELTANNIYWNCIDGKIVRHYQLDENSTSFTEAEKRFYDAYYYDYLEGQNERNIAARHKERCRTMDQLRENPKTCPEETIYQIGNIDNHINYEELVKVVTEFFIKLTEMYGDRVHILDWALHIDEGTPHIHERHVFDVINKYGERQPKQEEALKQLGFELPDPDKKPGKYNNRKMSFDAECRKILMHICKEHGLVVEEEPVYGGKKYLEKQEYIIDKLNSEITNLKEECDKVNSLYESVLEEKNKLLKQKENLELKIEDMEGLVKDVSDIAYNRACEVIIDEVIKSTKKEDKRVIEEYKKDIESGKVKVPWMAKKHITDQLDNVSGKIAVIKNKFVEKVRSLFAVPEKKVKFIKHIVEKSKPSIMAMLQKEKERIARETAEKAHTVKPKERDDFCI